MTKKLNALINCEICSEIVSKDQLRRHQRGTRCQKSKLMWELKMGNDNRSTTHSYSTKSKKSTWDVFIVRLLK